MTARRTRRCRPGCRRCRRRRRAAAALPGRAARPGACQCRRRAGLPAETRQVGRAHSQLVQCRLLPRRNTGHRPSRCGARSGRQQ
ncbi:MAG: hypothetical protein E6I52_17985 [Chloroflexi bacterium]|nr:MAG: hypothetical protein E6I52_17985 [Chloroflexota bacterium]